MKKNLTILGLTALLLAACGTRQGTCNIDTALVLTEDSIPSNICVEIRMRNVMGVWMDSTGKVYLNQDYFNDPPPPPPPGEDHYEYVDDRVPCDIGQLREKVIHFLANPDDASDLPEKYIEDIPLLGKYLVSKGGVSLHTLEGAPVEAIDQVHHEIAAAVIILRDSLSLKVFGLHYCELTDEQASAIRTAIPFSAYDSSINRFYRIKND